MADDFDGNPEDIRHSLESVEAGIDRLGYELARIWTIGKTSITYAVSAAGCLTWTIAAGVSDDLPFWPSLVLAALTGATFIVLRLQLGARETWESNVRTLRDNQLVLAVGFLFSLATLLLGLWLG